MIQACAIPISEADFHGIENQYYGKDGQAEVWIAVRKNNRSL